MSKIEPQIDPWELMVEHNQRIQQLEALIKQQSKNTEELARALNRCFELQSVNQRTIDKILLNQQANAEILLELITKTSQKQ